MLPADEDQRLIERGHRLTGLRRLTRDARDQIHAGLDGVLLTKSTPRHLSCECLRLALKI